MQCSLLAFHVKTTHTRKTIKQKKNTLEANGHIYTLVLDSHEAKMICMYLSNHTGL